jgi:UDP-N-acetylmuramyl pentapeptide synthase
MDKDRCIDATSHQEAAAIVSSKIRAGDFILVKGSRGMEMEKVIASLEEGER